MKTIEILIDPEGQATLQTKGFTGSSCRQASKFLEAALGQAMRDERTADHYQAPVTKNLQQERNDL